MNDNIQIIKEAFRYNIERSIVKYKYQLGITGYLKYLTGNTAENIIHQANILDLQPDPVAQDIAGAIDSVFDCFLD